MPTSPMLRPVRSAAAAALTLAVLLTGCAGTDGEAATAEPTPTAAPAVTTLPTDPATSAAPTPAPTSDDVLALTVDVTSGQASGLEPRTVVPLGTRVSLTITSDAPDEVHVHGYELTEQLTPGQPVRLEFLADRPGVFEVELHDTHAVLTRLQVQ